MLFYALHILHWSKQIKFRLLEVTIQLVATMTKSPQAQAPFWRHAGHTFRSYMKETVVLANNVSNSISHRCL